MNPGSTAPLTDSDLHDMEKHVFNEETLPCRIAQRLLDEVRRLRHELADPRFMYAGSRIHRHAIICRDNRPDPIATLLEAK